MSQSNKAYSFNRTVTLGMLITLSIQTASGLIWAGGANARLEAVESPSEGYAFFGEMLWQIHRSGGTIREVPITFTERRRGQSKVDWRQMLKGSGDLLRLGWATWTGKGTHR